MKLILHSIEIENFKTFAGKVVIGPLKAFMAVVGPNGSGKSNILDAVAFAVGEKVKNLRVKQLSDLIHGAHVGRPIFQEARVTLIFRFENGTLSRFARKVERSSQNYFYLNDEPATFAAYLAELEKIGINVKAKDFLVYQGTVESIALMEPKERTGLFEELSGSKNLKRQYDDLKSKMNQTADLTQLTYLKQRSCRNEFKDAKVERNEAIMCEQLQEEMDKKYIELQLFKLFYIQKDLDSVKDELSRNIIKLEEIRANKEKAKFPLKALMRSLDVKGSELVIHEREIHTQEAQIKEMQPPLIKAEEEIIYMNKKLESALTSLEKAKEVHKKHLQNIKGLKEGKEKLERERSDFEDKVTQESMSQGRDVELEESQAREYNELKRKAGKLSASHQQKIESLLREQKADQDCLDNESIKYSDIEAKIKKKCQEKDDGNIRCEKLVERIRSDEKDLKELIAKQQLLLSDWNSCKENMAAVQKDFDNICVQLSDAKLDKHEENQKMKKYKAVQSLKELFPGVYDRLLNLCEPIHKKYAIAITKVMGKFMHAIVVDKEKTARLCIQYLKEQMMEPETFLPLDNLEVTPIKEHLRQIKTPEHTHLLYDVLLYDPPQIKQAIIFATKSVVVCETPEDAMYVAYNKFVSKRVDAVSLDGSYFQKSGLISGGSTDLAKKAKRWDEKLLVQMQAQKESLSTQLKDLINKSRCESELKVVECEVSGFNRRINLMKADLEKSLRNIGVIDTKLDELAEILQMQESQINEIEKKIGKRGGRLKQLENELRAIEDKVFAEFCKKINVPNIRAYEEVGLRSYEDHEKKRMEFDDRINFIQNQIAYEENVDTKSNIKRWTDEVELRRSAIASAKLAERNYLKDIESASIVLDKYKKAYAMKKIEIDDLEKEFDAIQKNARTVNESIRAIEKQCNSLENKIAQHNRQNRSILIHCSTEGIKLPILEGNLDSLAPKQSETSGGSSTISGTDDSQAITSGIVIDYNQLADNLITLKEAGSIKQHEARLEENIERIANKLTLMNAPNMKVNEKLEETSERLRETNTQFDTIRRKAKMARDMFEKVKKERCDRFNECFDIVSLEIDVIYKRITKSTSGMAFLTAENQEEPYLGGINYSCISPGKACKQMQSLSGGEKTVASIALLIALHQYRSAPCLILDEIDAALDNTNIAKVAEFFTLQKAEFQTIAISLRPEFYCHADAVIGVVRDNEDGSSVTFLYDLEAHPIK